MGDQRDKRKRGWTDLLTHSLTHSTMDYGAGTVAHAEEPVTKAAVVLLLWHLDLEQGRAQAGQGR